MHRRYLASGARKWAVTTAIEQYQSPLSSTNAPKERVLLQLCCYRSPPYTVRNTVAFGNGVGGECRASLVTLAGRYSLPEADTLFRWDSASTASALGLASAACGVPLSSRCWTGAALRRSARSWLDRIPTSSIHSANCAPSWAGRLVSLSVTDHPTAQWIAQQITEAFPWRRRLLV